MEKYHKSNEYKDILEELRYILSHVEIITKIVQIHDEQWSFDMPMVSNKGRASNKQ